MDMKKLLVLVVLAILSMPGFAYRSQFGVSEVGNAKLEAIGKYKFSDFVTVDLAPTNAPSTNAVYAVRCQVIYTDRDEDGPLDTDLQRRGLQLTGGWLLEQLEDFVAANYSGAEFADLIQNYYIGAVGVDINQRFPLVVKERMAEVGLDLDVVRVQVLADADLLRELQAFQQTVRR